MSDLHALVARARAVLDAGRPQEAIDLVQAARGAGYDGADARVILGAALARQGDSGDATRVLTEVLDDPEWGTQARGILGSLGAAASVSAPGAHGHLGPIDVAHPFPARDRLPVALQRVIQDADNDIARGRYESALDLTLYAETLAPDELSLFLRHAELLVATGRPVDALRLVEIVERLARVRGIDLDEIAIAGIVAHADPGPEHVLRLARLVIAQGRADLAERYVPAAIAILVDDHQPTAALDLARAWQQLPGAGSAAQVAYVRELLRSGNVEEAARLAEGSYGDAHALAAGLAASVAAGSVQQWVLAGRLIRQSAGSTQERQAARRLLADLDAAVPDGRLRLHAALLALAAQDFEAVRDHLRRYQPADAAGRFAAAVALARSAFGRGDEDAGIDALGHAFALCQDPALADSTSIPSLFDPPATRLALGQQLAERLTQRGEATQAADVYRRLLELDPDNATLKRDFARSLGRAGQRPAALAILERLLADEEAAGQHGAAIETLRAMVAVAPGETALRVKLIDAYMRRGKVREAVADLFVLAQLLEHKGRIDEAVAQLRRAGEIASLTGEWNKVDQIYAYMVRLKPDDVSLRHAAVTTFIQQGQISRALEHLREVVRISLEREDADEAIAALHQLIALAPGEPEAYHQLGEILASVGEYGQAERVYRRLSALLPDDPSVKAKERAMGALARGSV